MTGLPSQALRYFAPSAALARYVTNLFVWTGQQAAFEAWMPAIESQLFFRLDGYGAVRFRDTAATLIDRPMLVGPMAGSMHIRTTHDLTAVGAGLTARGYHRLIGVPAGLLANQAIDLSVLIGARAFAPLISALLVTRSHEARVLLLERWMARRIAAFEGSDARAAAVDDWLATPAPATLGALHDRLGVSGRQAERITHDLAGIGPKSLAMRQRALRAAARIAGDPSAAVLEAAGYADQSHMIRDFGRFIGVTPAQLARVEIQRHVFEDPERAGATLAQVPRGVEYFGRQAAPPPSRRSS